MITSLRLVYLALVCGSYAKRSFPKKNFENKKNYGKGVSSSKLSYTNRDIDDNKFFNKGSRAFRGTHINKSGLNQKRDKARMEKRNINNSQNKNIVRRSFTTFDGNLKRKQWGSNPFTTAWSRKKNGSWCGFDGQCLSGRCGSWFKCTDKKPNGSWCAEDGACESDRCGSLFTCIDKNEIGEGCVEDGACKSGRCGTWFTCTNRKKNGESCNDNGQCETYYCTGTWHIWGTCAYDSEDFDIGTTGSCSTGSPSGQIKVMTYNVFAINCIANEWILTCQKHGEDKTKRLQAIPKYFENLSDTSSPDVIIMQELFDRWEDIRDGMTQAGYCHYVTTTKGNTGSGMAVYSKYEITKHDFQDWFDSNQKGRKSSELEAVADKGVMYTRVNKDGTNYNIFNTHTQSNSVGDGHNTRMYQFEEINKLVEKQNIPSNEIVLIGGDLNEDKFSEEHPTYFDEMLDEMNAVQPEQVVNNENEKYSYNTEDNAFLNKYWDDTYKEFLDVVLYKKDYLQPAGASCKIMKPKHEDGSEGNNLSDHYGNLCTFN